MTTVPGSLQAAEGESLGARYFHALCDRHGVDERGRSKLLEKLLEISYHAAHRRVTGEVPLALEELALVAQNFGETLDDLVLGARLAESAESLDEVVLGERLAQGGPLPGATPALFVLGVHRARCQAWLGQPVAKAALGVLVAHQVGREWLVTPATPELPANAVTVRSLVLDPVPVRRKRVAVLDDSQDIVDSVTTYLRGAGFDAEPFLTIASLATARAEKAFDAYVLDWLIGSESTRHLIGEIRANDKDSVITVLTGQIDSGKASVDDVADALATYGVQPFIKPLSLPFLAATLTRLLEPSKDV